MRLLKITNKNISKAIEILQVGGAVVFPTETIYGLAGNPFDETVVEKIYRIKGRSFDKPLPLIANDLKVVEKYFRMNQKEKELAKKFWPGALTMILPLRSLNSLKSLKMLNKVGNDIAVRMSSDKVAQKLAQGLGGLVISTSANLSNLSGCSGVAEIKRQFGKRRSQPDLILDGGCLKNKKPSTIVKVEKNRVRILRQGEVEV